MTDNLIETIIAMHRYRRPHGSVTERAFIERYIEPLPNAECDPFGNWHVTIDDAPILWSCHLDTVHTLAGMQDVFYRPKRGTLQLDRKERASNCLGADDTAGVWLCREMIKRKVPGHYIFHYGEERGGIGSSALARAHPEFLRQFQAAIALDRQGTRDVITWQGFGRSASDLFAESLAYELNIAAGLQYQPCSTGIYTDTAEYVDLIPECTNVSVGYTRAHSPAETLDVWHLLRLLPALSAVRIDALVIDRDPDAIDADAWELADDDDDYEEIDADDLTLENDDLPSMYLDPAFYDVQKFLKRRIH